MRTRRSPRNQERLWRALGQQLAQAATPPAPAAANPDAAVPIAERWWLSKRTRAMLARDAARAKMRGAR